MNKRSLIAISLLVTLPLYADFGAIERALRAKMGRPTWIPGLGIARLASNIVHPEGVHDFQLAVFEHGRMDGEEAAQLMSREAVGFTQLVHARSRHEWTFIYSRPGKGDRVELLILTSDRDETVLVRCDLDAEAFGRSMDRPERLASVGR
ncbi:MAG TPA: hypothetical protein VII75_07460 [Thermoanaerobaculia bacterium]|nr:hypothetical protein [Thermoanaerobaculia bacterium]